MLRSATLVICTRMVIALFGISLKPCDGGSWRAPRGIQARAMLQATITSVAVQVLLLTGLRRFDGINVQLQQATFRLHLNCNVWALENRCPPSPFFHSAHTPRACHILDQLVPLDRQQIDAHAAAFHNSGTHLQAPRVHIPQDMINSQRVFLLVALTLTAAFLQQHQLPPANSG